MTKREYTIDVTDESLGRVASKVASILRGKDSPDFKPNVAPDLQVKILNVSKLKLTGNKMEQKTYKKFSGYPSGLKIIPFKKVFEKEPQKSFRKAVERMLPNNKLRRHYMKNLIFED
ncbi:MAG: 50S ribosomal protein L13 [Patescibacteria group bacterium]